jgi:hypothetical protein
MNRGRELQYGLDFLKQPKRTVAGTSGATLLCRLVAEQPRKNGRARRFDRRAQLYKSRSVGNLVKE